MGAQPDSHAPFLLVAVKLEILVGVHGFDAQLLGLHHLLFDWRLTQHQTLQLFGHVSDK